jgi:thiamine-monophosphate kinase
MGERERIERIAALFAVAGAQDLELGIGDDAAVLLPDAGTRLVWTVDAQVENVHFRRAWLSWRDVGYRSFIAAASDLSAMGAAPWCALSALSLPATLTDEELEELTRGQRDAAEAVGAKVVGGNLSRGDVVTVTTTLLGRATGAIKRSGALAGDGLWVAGEIGLAAAGLLALDRGVTDGRVDPAVRAWRRPSPRIAEGLAMARVAHAAIDVSDGLALDVSRIAEASGVQVVLDRPALLARGGEALARASQAVGVEAFDLALSGGEDYALVAASDVPIEGFMRIGEVREGRGVILRSERGEETLRDLRGFDHFEKKR